VRKKTREIIQVEIELPVVLSKLSLTKLVVDLMKNLLHQRNQIPLQYDCIDKDIKAVADMENVNPDGDVVTDKADNQPHSRAAARNSRQAARAAKSRAQFLKSSAKLVREVEQMEDIIRTEIETEELVSISFLFGATPLSPREVYTIPIPDTAQHKSTYSRVGVHLFRAMVTHDKLHNLTSSRLPVSNMFVLFCKSNSPPISTLQLLPCYSLPPIARCPRVNFIITSLESIESKAPDIATRRLRFTSGTSRLTPCIPESSPDSYPSPKCVSPGKSLEIEVKTCKKPQQMELCTPLVSRQEFSTPQVFRARCSNIPVSMELCTPAHSLSTDRSIQATVGMELCTPATRSENLCTPALNLRTRFREDLELCTHDDMQLCTPAVRTRVSDAMELCTPAMSRLELRNECEDVAIKDTGEDVDCKPDEKDSGFSSPDCSIETGDSPDLFWFVTPAPIRGFK